MVCVPEAVSAILVVTLFVKSTVVRGFCKTMFVPSYTKSAIRFAGISHIASAVETHFTIVLAPIPLKLIVGVVVVFATSIFALNFIPAVREVGAGESVAT